MKPIHSVPLHKNPSSDVCAWLPHGNITHLLEIVVCCNLRCLTSIVAYYSSSWSLASQEIGDWLFIIKLTCQSCAFPRSRDISLVGVSSLFHQTFHQHQQKTQSNNNIHINIESLEKGTPVALFSFWFLFLFVLLWVELLFWLEWNKRSDRGRVGVLRAKNSVTIKDGESLSFGRDEAGPHLYASGGCSRRTRGTRKDQRYTVSWCKRLFLL